MILRCYPRAINCCCCYVGEISDKLRSHGTMTGLRLKGWMHDAMSDLDCGHRNLPISPEWTAECLLDDWWINFGRLSCERWNILSCKYLTWSSPGQYSLASVFTVYVSNLPEYVMNVGTFWDADDTAITVSSPTPSLWKLNSITKSTSILLQ